MTPFGVGNHGQHCHQAITNVDLALVNFHGIRQKFHSEWPSYYSVERVGK